AKGMRPAALLLSLPDYSFNFRTVKNTSIKISLTSFYPIAVQNPQNALLCVRFLQADLLKMSVTSEEVSLSCVSSAAGDGGRRRHRGMGNGFYFDLTRSCLLQHGAADVDGSLNEPMPIEESSQL
ncbi:hypothetical protein XENOCAPTIV_014373, partial [Xenoophorus captivus]